MPSTAAVITSATSATATATAATPSRPAFHVEARFADLAAAFAEQGFVVARGLVERGLIGQMREHYMAMRAEGPKPGDMGGDPAQAADPLNRFPRMINMHGWDQRSAAWSAHEGITAAAGACIGQAAELCQTMLYFKPPGARGQAPHQDQQYITREPLVGAWTALDRSDRANGCMMVVPGSHRQGLQRVVAADLANSFTGGGTVMPVGAREVAVEMDEGDVLFFGGKTIHGSYANATVDRFRRCFICHYVGADAASFAPERGYHMSHLNQAIG